MGAWNDGLQAVPGADRGGGGGGGGGGWGAVILCNVYSIGDVHHY